MITPILAMLYVVRKDFFNLWSFVSVSFCLSFKSSPFFRRPLYTAFTLSYTASPPSSNASSSETSKNEHRIALTLAEAARRRRSIADS